MVNDGRRSTAEDTTQPGTGSALDASVWQFYRCLFELHVEWEAKAMAIRTGGSIEISSAANELANAWHGARQAHQVIEKRVEDAREDERQTQSALRNHRLAVHELLRHGLARTAGTPAHDSLARLIADLGPIGGDGPSPGQRAIEEQRQLERDRAGNRDVETQEGTATTLRRP